MPPEKIHMTELNEFLVEAILGNKSAVEAGIKDIASDGFIEIEIFKTDKKYDGQTIDFDLQGCECSGLNEHDYIRDYLGKTVYTSSAGEFVEFLSSGSSRSRILVNIEEGSWVISLLNFS